MNLNTSKMAILVIAFLAGGPLQAEESLAIRNCTWCHGSSAQGLSTAPRLAGQRDQYIQNQLLSFSEHLRDNPLSQQYMWPATAHLSPQAAHDLSAYFSALPPVPANDGDPELAAAGRAIYDEGIADSDVSACVVCHGPNAEGVRGIPRLGGLSYPYLKRRLEQWGEGFHAAAAPMPQIAGRLSPNQIDALASYLSFIGYESLE
ncbi:c-type cytochrome [Methylocapsa palsarum]|uniref:Cytochrome c553 n=1 Tax=Methylocapsa palsarum TaxID=1612308 RepID=A0A1I4CZG4_9HYPH|nr:c-type cytochrome [Methylocapsa palsarum]SFK86285.1 Cytochrome c553 [Methylocapsa palsarum]